MPASPAKLILVTLLFFLLSRGGLCPSVSALVDDLDLKVPLTGGQLDGLMLLPGGAKFDRRKWTHYEDRLKMLFDLHQRQLIGKSERYVKDILGPPDSTSSVRTFDTKGRDLPDESGHSYFELAYKDDRVCAFRGTFSAPMGAAATMVDGQSFTFLTASHQGK
jgi:hypothetical protein